MKISDKERFETIDMIRRDQALEAYFFRETKDPEWFPFLDSCNYFDPEHAPPLQISDDGKYSTGVEWNVLPYIFRIAALCNSDDIGSKYGDKVASFITSTNTNHQNNWRTIFWLSRILSALPNNYISEDLIGLIEEWLKIPGASSMISVDLSTILLPKLTCGFKSLNDIHKAEKLLLILLTITRNDPAGGLWGDSFRFLIEEHWLAQGITKSLDAIAKEFSKSFIVELINRLEHIITYRESHRKREERVDDLKISIEFTNTNNSILINLQSASQATKLGSIEFPKQTPRQTLIAKCLDIIGCKEVLPPEKVRNISRGIIKTHASLMGDGCLTGLNDSYLRNEKQPLEFMKSLLKDLLLRRTKFGSSDIPELIQKLYNQTLLVFPKLALYITGENINHLRECFFQAFESQNADVILEGLYFGYELESVLSKLAPLSKQERIFLLEKIEAGSILWAEASPAMEKEKSFWKQARFKALDFDTVFLQKYEEMKKITGGESKLSAAIGRVRVRSGWGKSPATVSELLEMSAEQIANLCKEFVPDPDDWNGRTIGGLAEAIENATKERPTHFLDNLGAFQYSGYLWISRIFRGVRETIGNSAPDFWGKLLPFISTYTAEEDFWNDNYPVTSYNGFTPNHVWVVDEVSGLVDATVKNRNNNLSPEHSVTIKRLLRVWIGRVSWPIEKNYKEPVIQAINCMAGKVLQALISLLLDQARKESVSTNSQSPNNIRWELEDIKLFNDLLQKDAQEFFTILGMYFPNICYLDKQWGHERIPRILNSDFFEGFFIGYLHNGSYHEDLFALLYDGYKRAKNIKTMDDRCQDILIQHITIAYLRGREDLNNTDLFKECIKNPVSDDFLEVVRFIGQIALNSIVEGDSRGDFEKVKKLSVPVIDLWDFILNRIPGSIQMETDRRKLIAQELLEFVAFVDTLDETSTLRIIRTIEFGLPIYFEGAFFLEHLLSLALRSDSCGHLVGQIVLALLDKTTPTFKKETIEQLVAQIAAQGAKESAKYICTVYAKRGHDFLVALAKGLN